MMEVLLQSLEKRILIKGVAACLLECSKSSPPLTVCFQAMKAEIPVKHLQDSEFDSRDTAVFHKLAAAQLFDKLPKVGSVR